MTATESIKARNEEYLRKLGVEVNPALPCIEPLDEVSPRSPVEVAQIFVALSYMIRIGYDFPIPEAREYLTKLGVNDVLGSTTLEILNSGKLSEQQKVDIGWQAEAAQAIAWALGLAEIDNTRHCDEDLAVRLPFGDGEHGFIQAVQLRSISEIQEQVDLIYRMHWYTVNCRLTGKDCILNESIIRERRRALDWIYGIDEDWDEIPMHT
ncbi:MAG: DUF4272 domain-containing protein [Pseudomonadota bacterium]